MKSATVYYSVWCDHFYHYFTDLNTTSVDCSSTVHPPRGTSQVSTSRTLTVPLLQAAAKPLFSHFALFAAAVSPLGMKAVGIGRKNTLTIFVFIFLFGNGNGKARSGKRNRLCRISETVQSDRKHVDNGREPVLKSGNEESCNPSEYSTRHNGHNYS